MSTILLAAVIGLGSGKSKYRWPVLAAFCAGILLAILTGFMPWYSLIAVPLSAITSEVVHWADAST